MWGEENKAFVILLLKFGSLHCTRIAVMKRILFLPSPSQNSTVRVEQTGAQCKQTIFTPRLSLHPSVDYFHMLKTSLLLGFPEHLQQEEGLHRNVSCLYEHNRILCLLLWVNSNLLCLLLSHTNIRWGAVSLQNEERDEILGMLLSTDWSAVKWNAEELDAKGVYI